MLSPDSLSICIYGDSHIACIKHALDEGLVSVPQGGLEFWGASGPAFRGIHLKGGRLQPQTQESQEQVRMISDTGRDSLGPEDFDVFLFVGSRLRSQSYVVPMLWRAQDDAGYLSKAVRDAVLDRWLTGCRSYRAACAFAALGQARVFFSPASFMNDQVLDEKVIVRSINQQATAEQRAALWEGIARRMAQDGVSLIAQPEETVTRGCLTRMEFASSRATELQDPVHKNGAFGALLLKELFARLASDPAGAGATADAPA
ncbi:hypothetical protein [Phycobacter sp. K97]|uniref:hypothetical protein n=1 Tax=Phycobacter sedimenti TaxID=3133977 RepID=UPI00311E96D0